MIKKVTLGEEITVTAKNKVGVLADIATMLANKGVNVESALGFQAGSTAKLMLVTSANLIVVGELKKRKFKSVKEAEVVMIGLEDKPGALKIVTTELKKAKIDIKYLYVTTMPSAVNAARMVIQTSDNEKAMAVLSKYTNQPE
jgi:hypothetical protein